MRREIWSLLMASALLNPSVASGQRGLKVYISADMEGVVGVVTDQQLGPSGFEYTRFREFMTQEVIAAIEEPTVIVKILAHLGLPTRAPPRSPPQAFCLSATA